MRLGVDRRERVEVSEKLGVTPDGFDGSGIRQAEAERCGDGRRTGRELSALGRSVIGQRAGQRAQRRERLYGGDTAARDHECVVDHHRARAGEALDRPTVLDHDARARRAGDARDDRDRRGQDERAGRGDDEHGERPHRVAADPGRAGERQRQGHEDDGQRSAIRTNGPRSACASRTSWTSAE